MKKQDYTNQDNGDKAGTSDSHAAPRKLVDAGHILLHKQVAQQIVFTDVYRGLRRHETGEIQPCLPESLCELAEDESKQSGLHVTYHVASTDLVFAIITAPRIRHTFVRLAPIEDLDRLVIENNHSEVSFGRKPENCTCTFCENGTSRSIA